VSGLIYRAVSNGYDILRPIPEEDGVVAKTFLKLFDDKERAVQWNRIFKIRGFKDEDMDGHDFEWSLYLDGTLVPKVPVKNLVESWLADADIAVFRHPERNCPFEELDSIIRLRKGTTPQVAKAGAFLKKHGARRGMGLYACGVIARRYPQPEWLKELQEWWIAAMTETGLRRDQPFLPVGIEMFGVKDRIKVIDASVFNSPWFDYKRHGT